MQRGQLFDHRITKLREEQKELLERRTQYK